MALVLLGVTTTQVEAKTKKKKNRATTSKVSSYKKKKSKKNRLANSKRYKRSGTGPDLRALTTEQPDAEYTQTPDNGVNAVETTSEL
jgi:hypothetical protein